MCWLVNVLTSCVAAFKQTDNLTLVNHIAARKDPHWISLAMARELCLQSARPRYDAVFPGFWA